MAELTTIARPYAQAVFDLARDGKQLGDWSGTLGFLTAVYTNAEVQTALANPTFTKADVERLLLTITGERLDGAARNLLMILVRNDRLPALPEIATLYERLKEQYENVLDAQIESAYPLDQGQLGIIVQRLEQRTGHKVQPSVSVNPALIGGVKIQIGDDVWDGSVLGQLEGMASTLAS
jgi:F-type H+-transporting ATPase subunit delta